MNRATRSFRYLEPTFFAGLLDDPVLLVRVRPLGHNLLFDCGQIHHLAKRVLKQTRAIFISHAHMDHFMGIDTFVRNVLVSPRTFDLFGPPGLAKKLHHKLAGYDWNLAERFWCTLRVNEVHAESVISWLLSGPEGFSCRWEKEEALLDRVIYRNDYLQVEAVQCDHKIPVLAFCCRERPAFTVDSQRLADAGLVAGPWLADLKRRFNQGFSDKSPIRFQRCGEAETADAPEKDAEELYAAICGTNSSASIGYLTDVGYNRENVDRLVEFFQDLSLFIVECSFLREDVEKARRSHHLCTDDINRLLDRLRPVSLLPMHLSKTYNGRCRELYQQLELPPQVRLVKLPEHLLNRPLLPCDLPRLRY